VDRSPPARRIERALRHAAGYAERAWALIGTARLAFYVDDKADAVALASEAVGLARGVDDRRLLGYALYVRALAAIGALERGSVEFGEESVEVPREAGDRWALALALCYCGMSHLFLGDQSRAAARLGESESLFGDLGDDWGRGGALFYLGWCPGSTPDTTREHVAGAVALFRAAGDRWRLQTALSFLADAAGDEAEAASMREEAAGLRRELGIV
jgi:hypothetical protein